MSEETAAEAIEETEQTAEEEPQRGSVQEETAEEPTGESETAQPEPVEEKNERSKPPVIDLAVLLKPISDENPSGESVRYSGVYDEISEARRADEQLEMGEWEHELKVADYTKVIELATNTLTNETKDLQISAWFCEALVREHGFAGLRDSLRLMSGLISNFWDTLFPEVDEGDEEARANALAWMDKESAFSIRKAPITEGEGYGFIDYQDAKIFDIPENYENFDSAEREKYAELEERAAKQHRTTADKWKKAVALSKRNFYEDLDAAINECFSELEKINKIAEEKFDPNQVPALNEIKTSLDEIQIQTNKLLEKKREEEPDPELDYEESEEGMSESASTGGSGSFSVGGAINSRREALKRLSEVARFFSRTEPHSPVSYLVNRAVKWGEMPLDSWLSEVVKDETTLSQLREMLGVKEPVADDGWGTPAEETTEEEKTDDW